MFLRKLVVIFVPLLLAGLLCVAIPLILQLQLGFWTNVLMGGLLGISLGLLLSLSGLSKRREPFAGLLWVPLTALIVAVLSQYLALIGISVPVLDMLRTGDGNVVLVECAFIGFLAVQMIRTRK